MSYATYSDFEAHMSSAGGEIASPNRDRGELALGVAQEQIDSACGRSFDQAADATDQYLWPEWDRKSGCYVVVLDQDVYAGLVVKVDDGSGLYATTLTLTTDYIPEPRNGVRDGITGWPTDRIRFRTTRSIPCTGDLEPLKITGKVGWAVTPYRVKESELELAAMAFKMKEAPFGFSSFGDMGLVRVRDNAVVQGMLRPLAKPGGTLLGGIA